MVFLHARMPAAYGEPVPDGFCYPTFVKPVKAAFSVLAKVVHSQEELHQFTRFGAYELWVIKRLVEPFERIAKKILPQAGTAHSMIMEAPANTATAQQYSLDGVAFQGSIQPLGVVDAVMYPGTQAFMRFDYPSQLPQTIQDRALDVATKFLNAIGYSHGLFNMEFFYDPGTDKLTDKLTVIEFNPRMASQFADLYLRVDGIDLYAMALELAHGRDPYLTPRHLPTAQFATSAVYRVFDSAQPTLQQSIPPMPAPDRTTALALRFPDHLLLRFPKTGGSTARDFKWLGSYRYGILHLGGQSEADLKSHLEEASELLAWPTPLAENYQTATFSQRQAHNASSTVQNTSQSTTPQDLSNRRLSA